MKKQVTLILMAFLSLALNLQAKTFETTLWEGAYTGEVELNAETVATFKAGDVLRVYVTVPENGANFKIVYKGAPKWEETTIPSINDQWPWVNGGETYKDFALTADDITALSGQNIYIYKGENSTINKVMLTGEVSTTGETPLFDSEWTSSWDAKSFAAQSAAKIGDVIQVQYKAFKDEMTGWPWVQFYFMDASGNNFVDPVAASKEKNSVTTFEFEIKTADVLEKIQNAGFSIKGDQFILTSVKLLTYEDSYDAVSITVGSDGIATYSNGNKNVQISACDALKAYYASAVATGAVTLTELTGCIPANQGVIIKGAGGTYTVKVGGEGWENLSNKNYLKPSNGGTTVTASTTGAYHYIFAKKGSGTPAFYKLIADHTLAAHKAYLETSTDIKPTSAPLMLDFGNGTTAIMDVFQDEMKQQPVQEDGVYYTLQGTRVQNPTKGLYILNGKKIIVK